MSIVKTVYGFKPSQNGFQFANRFSDVPYQFKVLGIPITTGHAYNGLCGGMIFTVCDLFYAGKKPPADQDAPSAGPVYNYLCQRLIDSFALPFGPLQYYLWMNPTVKDTQAQAGGFSLAANSRAWKMIRQEWPKIRREIDSNRLCTIGLILLTSWAPNDLGKNHQVLVYGYELEGDALKLMIYDPNAPGDDGAHLSVSLADPTQVSPVAYGNSGGKIKDALCFFKTGYTFKNPAGRMP
jgi:hypothetical protein